VNASHRHTLNLRRRHGIGLALQRHIGRLTRERLEVAGAAAWPPEQDAFWAAFRDRASMAASLAVIAELRAELEGTAEPPQEPGRLYYFADYRVGVRRPSLPPSGAHPFGHVDHHTKGSPCP
jgi:hypothetical protein